MEKNIEKYLRLASQVFNIITDDKIIFQHADRCKFTITDDNMLKFWPSEMSQIQIDQLQAVDSGNCQVLYYPNTKIPADLFNAWIKKQIHLKHISSSFYEKEFVVRIFKENKCLECIMTSDNLASSVFLYKIRIHEY